MTSVAAAGLGAAFWQPLGRHPGSRWLGCFLFSCKSPDGFPRVPVLLQLLSAELSR